MTTERDERREFNKWLKAYKKKFLFAPRHFDVWQAGRKALRENHEPDPMEQPPAKGAR